MPGMNWICPVIRTMSQGIYRNEAFNARQPEQSNPIIYHYTDLNGLQGIINLGGFWMTDNRFLNDTGEIEYGLNLFQETLKEFKMNLCERCSSRLLKKDVSCFRNGKKARAAIELHGFFNWE